MRSEGTPIYQQLLNDLKKSIDEGKYKNGDLLPSENDLCRTYSTTRPTVRQALSALKALGYIHKHHGKGSMVNESKKGLGILSVIGVTAGVGSKDLKTEIIQQPLKADWPADFFYPLSDTATAAGSIFFSRLRRLHDVPTLFEETYITDISLPRFTARRLENRSLFKTLKEHYGVEVKEGEQSIWAVAADKAISKVLQVKTGSPILHIKRKLNTNVSDLHIYSWLYCNTADYHLQDYF
jgi:DNA-binding GntR family transcriptional regulator